MKYFKMAFLAAIGWNAGELAYRITCKIISEAWT